VWGELAFLALGGTAAGMLLWNRAVLYAGSTRVSLLLYLEPAVSVLGALVFLGEHVTLATIASGLLILAGVTAAGTTHPTASLWRQAHRRSSPQKLVRGSRPARRD
jgi:drug/metabolite transporter (DMT)-like permease